MKKLTSIFAALLFGVVALSAQNAFVGGHRAWTFALQGGGLYSVNENRFTYHENNCGWKLVTPQGSVAVGYEFTEALGVRVSVGYGLNASACNSRQTAAHGFYPYRFRSVNAFVDGVLDLKGNYGWQSDFRPIFYLGIGLGHTYHFTKPDGYGNPRDASWTEPFHPWQSIKEKNNAFGFRGGFIAEYDFSEVFGIFGDFCLEAYRDNYNGLQPTKEDQTVYQGYAGFPLDLRPMISLGVIFRINR